MNIPLDEAVTFDCIVSNPTTGAAVDADATPTFAVFEEATDTAMADVGGDMTKRTSLTGNYRGSFTTSAANGFEVGKWYNVIATAVVGGVTGKAVAKSFRLVLAETTVGAVQAVVPDTQKVDLHTIKTQAVTLSGGVTFPAATLASTTNITAGTITTVTNLTNAPTAGDFTSTMKASINSEADQALADYDGPTNAEMEARTIAAASYGTAANQTTILNRIGAFTGSGVNTLLGFFKALLSKTASTPSDVGGTFDPATDSTEAIRDRGDAEWTGGDDAATIVAAWQSLELPNSGGKTYGEGMELIVSVAASGGKCSGVEEDGTQTVVYRNLADSANLLSVASADGFNRTTVTWTPSS